MQYEIEVTKHFERLLRKLDIEIIKRIRDKILELKTDPYANKPLVGQLSGLRSMRVEIIEYCT
jgi:mRNA-degrading endonuclease RelE of RelBE toxin-antitoxin system